MNTHMVRASPGLIVASSKCLKPYLERATYLHDVSTSGKHTSIEKASERWATAPAARLTRSKRWISPAGYHPGCATILVLSKSELLDRARTYIINV